MDGVCLLGASKKWTGSVRHPFRPIFGSFQKMDGVCLSIRSVQFLGASKKWTESVHRPWDGVCLSSVPSNFWELPKNGRGLSILLVLIRHQFEVSKIR